MAPEGKDNAGKLFIPETPVQGQPEASPTDWNIDAMVEFMTKPLE